MSCRLLYLIGQLTPGGSERQLFYLLERMERRWYLPAVVVWNYCEADPYVAKLRGLHVPLYPLPYPTSSIRKLLAFRQIVRRIRPEIVHSYSSYTNFAAWLATRSTQTVAFGSVRSDFLQAERGNGRLLGRFNARWPRNQIFNNYAAAETVRRSRRFFAPRQFVVIRNGIDLQYFCSVPLVTRQRAHIVGVGSLRSVKRWDRLLRSTVTLKQSGCDFLVQIVGDGPLRGSLQREAQRLGIADWVEFVGYRDDVPGILADATFVVHTSDSEGCPNAVMEAMACGRAVVAMDAGDVASLVEDGKTGFVVPNGDEDMLVQRLTTLIANRDLCRRMGEAGHLKAEREFGLDRLVSETLMAYHDAGWRGV